MSAALGPASLTVTELDRARAFYTDVVGLRVRAEGESEVRLGSPTEDVVVLSEDPAARPAGRHAGLYHVAILYPSRAELARAARRVAVARSPIQGASDHGTHEAIYLPDPDGNGLELAADRPRDEWPELRYLGGPEPLDTAGLLASIEREALAPRAEDGVRVGHVHLHVSDLDAARTFYEGALGLEVMTDLDSALFLARDGYHHHGGLNVWRGQGIPSAPAGAVGLRHWTLELDDPDDLEAVERRLGGLTARDPDQIEVRVRARGA